MTTAAKVPMRKVPNVLLTEEEELALARQMREGDAKAARKARDTLIARNDGLAYKYAHQHRRYARNSTDFDDLLQEARIGLIRGVERFDPVKAVERGARLSSYVTWFIMQAISLWIYENRSVVSLTKTSEIRNIVFRLPRALAAAGLSLRNGTPSAGDLEELAIALQCSVDAVSSAIRFHLTDQSMDAPVGEGGITFGETLPQSIQESHEQTVLDDIERTRQLELLRKVAKESLSERDYAILMARYAPEGAKPLARLSSEASVSKERIRQLEVRALEVVKRRVYLAQMGGRFSAEDLRMEHADRSAEDRSVRNRLAIAQAEFAG